MQSLWLLLLGVSSTWAIPARHNRRADSEAVVIEGNGPSNSFYDHFMGNLQNSNNLVHLAMLPHGIPPPEDDYVDVPVPIPHYAFVNPALDGVKTPHWTDTLQHFKNNPAVSPEIKNTVLLALPSPLKIYGDGTESKFPLFVEYFVQRIQNYFSTYVHEDMSRPASWDVKANATDGQVVSSDKEPIVTEAAKIATTPSSGLTTEDDIDYIVDFTLRPDIDEIPDVELTDEDFEKTTEEWEAPKEDNKLRDGTEASVVVAAAAAIPQVIVEKETLDLKVVEPIALDDDAFLYVGDGNGDELTRSNNKRKKLKKKKKRNGVKRVNL